jgi:glycosyltransferase involved in cell wall biosynthesis
VEKRKSYPSLSVVIPVYNERATLEELVRRVQDVPLEKEIILVDDASTDGTRELLQQLVKGTANGSPGNESEAPLPLPWTNNRIRVLFHDRNRGKGAALRTGFNVAQGEIILVQDADLEYDPQDYFTLLDPIRRGSLTSSTALVSTGGHTACSTSGILSPTSSWGSCQAFSRT